MKRFNLKIFLILSFFVLTLFSCKIRFINNGIKDYDNIRPVKLFRLLNENEFEYDYLSMKFSAEIFMDSTKETFSGIIRIKRDSIIWISLRSFNIEGARIIITQDSVKYIDRLNSTYFVGNYSFLSENFSVDFDYFALQGILTNNFFFYPPPEDTLKSIQEFKPCDDSLCYCMSSISKRKFKRYYVDGKMQDILDRKLNKDENGIRSYESDEFVFQIVKVLPTIYKISETLVQNYYQNQSLTIIYDKHYRIGTRYFPENIYIEFLVNQFKIKLILNFESVTIEDDPIKFPFKISDKYQEIKVNQ